MARVTAQNGPAGERVSGRGGAVQAAADGMTVPPGMREPHRTALLEVLPVWAGLLGERLVSLVLFGSIARGDARSDSDIDVLAVARDWPRSFRERRAPLIQAWTELRSRCHLPAVEWNLVTKTPEEARVHSPLYLDMVEDAVLLFDREGFFASVLEEMRQRMRALGSRRIFLNDGSWYWDLKPDYRFPEVVDI